MGQSRAKKPQYPAYIFDLGNHPIADVSGNGFTISMRAKGTLAIQNTQPTPFDITVQGLNQVAIHAKREAETLAGKLISGTTIKFDAKTKSLTFSNTLTMQSNMEGSPKVALSAGVNAQGQPVLTGSVTQKLLKGKVTSYLLAGQDIALEFEVALDEDITGKKTLPQPSTVTANAPNPLTTNDPQSNVWKDAAFTTGSALLVIGAVILPVVTIAEDFVPVAGGVANDMASFALAGAMFTLGRTTFIKYSPALFHRFSMLFYAAAGVSSAEVMAQPEGTKAFGDSGPLTITIHTDP